MSAAIVGAMLVSLATLAAYGGSYDIGPSAEPMLLLDINESGFLPTLEKHVNMSKSDCDYIEKTSGAKKILKNCCKVMKPESHLFNLYAVEAHAVETVLSG